MKVLCYQTQAGGHCFSSRMHSSLGEFLSLTPELTNTSSPKGASLESLLLLSAVNPVALYQSDLLSDFFKICIMSLKLVFYLHFRCSVVVCRWNSGIWEPQFREMGNTGRNLALDQITPILFDNHQASQKSLVVILPLSVSAYRLSTNLGTVLHRKITTRRLMTLVSSSDLFKPVCGSVRH